MTCKINLGPNEVDDCKCHNAVMNAYAGMKHCGEEIALDAALRVYHFHHPEDALELAALTVGRWVAEDGHVH